jgi:hypothetical protein
MPEDRNGVPVIMKVWSRKFKSYRNYKDFCSIQDCARFMLEKGYNTPNQLNVDDIANKIREIISGVIRQSYNRKRFTFSSFELFDLDDEEWKVIPKTLYPQLLERYKVSNRGRVRKFNGYPMTNRQLAYPKKYSQVCLDGNNYYVHLLVWEIFNNQRKPTHNSEGIELDMCHNDTAPLHEMSYQDDKKWKIYRNFLEDLRLGTRSENMIEHYEAINNPPPSTLTPARYQQIQLNDQAEIDEDLLMYQQEDNNLPDNFLDQIIHRVKHNEFTGFYPQNVKRTNPTYKFVIGRSLTPSNTSDLQGLEIGSYYNEHVCFMQSLYRYELLTKKTNYYSNLKKLLTDKELIFVNGLEANEKIGKTCEKLNIIYDNNEPNELEKLMEKVHKSGTFIKGFSTKKYDAKDSNKNKVQNRTYIISRCFTPLKKEILGTKDAQYSLKVRFLHTLYRYEKIMNVDYKCKYMIEEYLSLSEQNQFTLLTESDDLLFNHMKAKKQKEEEEHRIKMEKKLKDDDYINLSDIEI